MTSPVSDGTAYDMLSHAKSLMRHDDMHQKLILSFFCSLLSSATLPVPDLQCLHKSKNSRNSLWMSIMQPVQALSKCPPLSVGIHIPKKH